MRQRRSTIYWELLINLLLVLGPLLIMADGVLGLLQTDSSHPDVFVQFGGLMMGVISLVTLLVYWGFWLWAGRDRVPGYRQGLWLFHAFGVLVGTVLALMTVGVIDPVSILRLF